MGHTHYLTPMKIGDRLSDVEWRHVQLACMAAVMFTGSISRIRDVQIDNDGVFFNTPTSESVGIPRTAEYRVYCKTGEREDDLLVSTCMQVVELVSCDTYKFTSDGGLNETQPGRTLAYMCLKTAGWERET